jgi:hypothetical protein
MSLVSRLAASYGTLGAAASHETADHDCARSGSGDCLFNGNCKSIATKRIEILQPR